MLTNYITDPYSLTIDDLVHLENVTKRYPSFSLGYTLIAKAVQTKAPEIAQDAIKKAAVYAINRNALRKFMEVGLVVHKPAEANKPSENDVDIEEEFAKQERQEKLIQEIINPPRQSKQEEQLVLIDRFIQAEPRISPIRSSTQQEEVEDLSLESTILKDKILTESFARVLIQQANFPKAIEVYQELCLIKPEKKTYFVEKITELNKKLI